MLMNEGVPPASQIKPVGHGAVVDQGVDLAGAAGVEEDVALADARLLEQQAGLDQPLADVVGERAIVAREAPRQVGELGVVAAPLAHAGEALEDAAGRPPRPGPGGARARSPRRARPPPGADRAP